MWADTQARVTGLQAAASASLQRLMTCFNLRSAHLFLFLAVGFGSCVAESRAPTDIPSFEEFKRTLWDGHHYVYQQDVRLGSEQTLRMVYAREHPQTVSADSTAAGIGSSQQALGYKSLNTTSGKLALTFCMTTQSFANQRDEVTVALIEAARRWERVANVRFSYRREYDNTCTNSNTNVWFNVREATVAEEADGGWTAQAFYPSEARSTRELILYAKMFAGGIDLARVLTHELGHVLGFFHEHFRVSHAQASCNNTTTGVTMLTPYDSTSIMHYEHCDAGAWKRPGFPTSYDRMGAFAAYGPSLSTRQAISSQLTGTYWRSADLGQIQSVSTNLDGPSVFDFMFHSDGTVSFANEQKGYLSAQPNGTLVADRGQIAAWEKFVLVWNADATVSFVAHTGKYISVDPAGVMNANASVIGPATKFRLIAVEPEPDAMYSPLAAQFWAPRSDGMATTTNTLTAATDIQFVYFPSGKIALRSTGKWLRPSELEGDTALQPTTTLTPNDLLTVVAQPAGRIALRTQSGNWLSSPGSDQFVVVALGGAHGPGEAEQFVKVELTPAASRIRTANGTHLLTAPVSVGGNFLWATGTASDESTNLYRVGLGNGEIGLRTYFGLWVTPTGGGGTDAPLAQDKMSAHGRFTEIPLGAGIVAFRTHDGLHYLSASNGGGSTVRANYTSTTSTWTQFRISP